MVSLFKSDMKLQALRKQTTVIFLKVADRAEEEDREIKMEKIQTF